VGRSRQVPLTLRPDHVLDPEEGEEIHILHSRRLVLPELVREAFL